MAEGDFDIKAVISAQTSQFEKGLKDCQSSVSNLTNSLGKISDIVKKAFAFTGITVGIKSITDFGKACVQSATQAEKTFSILDNTIKTTGADAWTSINELTEVSKTLSDTTNYSVTEIQRMQSVLLGFTNITGEAFDGASEAVLDMATVMGMDLTSAVQTVGKALDDPINGLDSLRRQGFHFTEEQKEQLKQLVENGNRMEAQKIILDELAVSYGGASQAGQTAFAKITHSIENFQDTLGSELIPFVKEFSDDIAGMINDMMEEVKKIDFTPIHDVLVAIEPLIKSAFGVMLDLLKSILPPLGTIANLLQPVFSILGNAISSVSSAISWFMGTEYDAEKSTSEMNKVLSLQADKVNDLTNEIRKLTVEQRNAQQASLKSAMLSQQSSIEKTKKLMEDLQKEITDLEDEYDELNSNVSAFQEVTVAGENIGEYYDPILAGIMRMNNAWEEGADKVEEVYENQKKLVEVEDGLKEKKERYNKLASELSLLSAEYESLQAQLKTFGDFELEEAERIERTRIEAENNAKKAKEESLNDLSKYIESYADKEIAQNIKLAQQRMDKEIEIAQVAGKSEEEIAEIRRKANEEIKGYMLQQIWNEEEAEKKKLEALEAVVGKTKEVEDLRTKIHDYYTNERESVELKFLEIIGNATEEQKQINYTWDIKLLQLQKESATRDKDKISLQKEIYELQKKQDLARADEADKDKIIKYYDELIKALDEDREKALNEIAETQEEIIENTKIDYTWKQKLQNQEISRLQTAMDSAVKIAKAEGKSEEEIAKIKEEYLMEIQKKQLEQLALQKEIDLAKSTSAEQAFEIDTYYSNQELILAEETARKIAEAYSEIPSPTAPQKIDYGEASEDNGTKEQEAIFAMMQEWEDKLFQQKLEHYEAEKEFELSAMEENNATQEELYERNKYYTDLILNMKLEALEKEKQAKLDSVADDEEHAEIRASIEQYYQNQANEMQKDAYKEKAKYLKKDEEETETAWSKFKNGVSTVSKYMVNGFKTAFSAVSKLFSSIGKIISGVWSGFVKALDFNPDETLDGLLAFEDKILTFFYDTLPQLPSFLANALQSIGTLLNTLLENIDFSGLAEMLADALGNAVDILPSLIQGVTKIVGEIVKQLPSIIKKVIPKIVSALRTIVKALPQILPDIIKGVFGMINGIAQSLPEMLPEIMSGLFELIKALIQELPTTIDLLLTGIANALQELVSNPDKITEFVHVIMEAVGNIARSLLENAGVIFGALIEILPDVLMAILQDLPSILGKIFEGAWNGVIAVLKGTVNALIKGVNFITQGLSKAWTWLGIPAIPKIPLLAKGTDNAQRGLAIVGEAGPELVNFRGGEQVLSNKKTNEVLSGSKTNNFNVTFNNVSDTSAYALVQQLKRYNREMAFNGVL